MQSENNYLPAVRNHLVGHLGVPNFIRRLWLQAIQPQCNAKVVGGLCSLFKDDIPEAIGRHAVKDSSNHNLTSIGATAS